MPSAALMRLCPPFAFVSRTRRSASSVVRRRAGTLPYRAGSWARLSSASHRTMQSRSSGRCSEWSRWHRRVCCAASGARADAPATRLRPSCCNDPSKDRGRRESRMPVAPAAWRAEDESTPAKSPQVQPDRSGLPRASGFNGFLRDLLGEPGFVATVAYGKPQA